MNCQQLRISAPIHCRSAEAVPIMPEREQRRALPA
jgi:hypothetical protein